jgi:dihydroorotate dehydrogenase (fumarate)
MDLTTNYLGLSLRSPLVPSASPLSEKIDNVRAMEQAGAAAVVFHSLFDFLLCPLVLFYAAL